MGGEAGPLTGPDLSRGVDAASIEEGKTLLGHADGEPVVLARCDGELFAVGAKCTHYGGPLDEGLVVDGTIRCPWHHASFDLRTGAVVRAPALNDLPCWRVDLRDGKAVVSGKREGGAPGQGRTGAPRARGRGPESVVIVGGGAAGAVAAETLRREGYDGPITILEAGPSGPVDRPNLSKDYLAGNAPEEWIPLRPDEFWSGNRIDLVLGRRVTALDPAARKITLDDGSTRSYGALLLATGATPVRLDVPGAERIRYLRTLADCRAIIEAASHAKRAVVIGASFIGLEVAASLRARGLEVTVVAPESRPLERVLGAELGDAVRAIHEKHGVVFRLGQVPTAVGANDVTITSGERLPADLVVAGVGVRPSLELAESAALSVDRGLLVDEFLETSAPGVFAAGDIARWPDAHTGDRIRVEHWVVAERQAQTAARNMLAGDDRDARERFDAIPFFWSAHYDVTIAYVGHAARWDEARVDGDPSTNDCEVSYVADGRVLAVATIFRDQASLRAELAMERALRAGRAFVPARPRA